MYRAANYWKKLEFFMANRLYHIDTQASTALGVAQVLNTNGVNNARFRVRNLHIRFALDVGSAGGGTAIGAGDIGATRIELLWRKTNRPFLNNVEARGLDFYCQREHQPAVGCLAYNTLVNQTIPVAANQTAIFDFKIPVEKLQAADGADYAQMLDEIGQLTIQLPAVLSAGTVTLNTWTTTFFAEGEDYEGAYFAGAQTRIDSLASSAGTTYEALCYGNKLRQIYSYSTNPGTPAVPLTAQTGETSPRVLFDGREVYNYRNLNGGDLAYYASNGWSQAGNFNAFYLTSTPPLLPQQSVICAPYVQLDPTKSIVSMDTVNVAQLTWAARSSATVAQDITFVVETIYPDNSGAALAQRVPGAAFMSAADVSALVSRPGPTGSAASAPIQDKAFLPAKVQM